MQVVDATDDTYKIDDATNNADDAKAHLITRIYIIAIFASLF
jgi:hypothetical protein